MAVVHVWAGATTDTTAWVRGKVTGASTRLALSLSSTLASPTYTAATVPTADGIVSFALTGLEPGVRYYYALEDDGVLDTAASGTFLTHPVAAGQRASYVFGAAGDAGLTGAGDDSYITTQVSDNPVFDTMRAQSLADDWLFFAHLGDLHYRNISTADAALYRAGYDDVLTFNGTGVTARQGQFFRGTAMTYAWDDHDFGPNNSDRTHVGNATANSVYRERVPHYTLPAADGIYQTWQIGRVLYIASDVRSYRDPNADPASTSKTMLGTGQKAWMESVLTASSGAEALVWITPSRWLADDASTGDSWNSFIHERRDVIEMFGDTGWLPRMIQLTADKHNLSICSGPANLHGGFPIYMLASLDSSYGVPAPGYDIGSIGGRQQYGTIAVRDSGHTIALTGTGWINGTEWMSHTAYAHVGNHVFQVPYARLNSFAPRPDEASVVNEFTTTRRDGGEYTYRQTSGPLNVNEPEDDPQGVGVYDEAATLDVYEDEQLPGQASWRVTLGTTDAPRYPVVGFNLQAHPELADDLMDLEFGNAFTVVDLPDHLPPDPVELIGEGTTETIGVHEWTMDVNASPAAPYTQIAYLPADAESAGPDQPTRLDTSGSELVDAVGGAATELVVVTPQEGMFDRAPWIVSAGLADAPNLLTAHFPFDLRIGGETVRATGIEPYHYDAFDRVVAAGSWGASDNGETWTLLGGATSERSVNGARAQVNLASSPGAVRLQMLPGTVGDCELRVRISVDQVATGASMVPGVVMRYTDISNWYRARIHFSLSGAMYASVTRYTTQVGTETLLKHTYTAGSEFNLRVRLVGHRILMRIWAVGDFEPPIWHHDQEITADTIDTGQVGISASAFSSNTNVSPNLLYDQFEVVTPQRATVVRGLNGASTPHDAGAGVALAKPARPGL